MNTDQLLAIADATGMVGPAYRATVTPTDGVAFALVAPALLVEIRHSGDHGTTWTERGVLHGTCARCGLGRPTSRLKLVNGRWYCDDETPKEA